MKGENCEKHIGNNLAFDQAIIKRASCSAEASVLETEPASAVQPFKNLRIPYDDTNK